jgi:hypothetical protein
MRLWVVGTPPLPNDGGPMTVVQAKFAVSSMRFGAQNRPPAHQPVAAFGAGLSTA